MAEGGNPEVSNQKAEIAKVLQNPLQKGDTWYILDLKWFKQWKSYVGYDSWDTYKVGEATANPGPIDNTPIFQEETTKLKEHLIDDLDYILLPEEGWNNLFKWYGMVEGQEPQARKVIEEGVYTKSLKVEVYPWFLKICENSKPDEQINKQFSRADTIEQLEKAMRQEFNISDDKEVRLWNRYMTNMYEPLNKKENTLQDAGLYQGQVVVIEQKNEDGTWPRQQNQNKTTSTYSKEAATGTSSFSTRSGNTYGGGGYGGGYSYDPGRSNVTPGLCGLSNIGNTCFMNSALQCMSNVPQLTKYFLSKKWEDEINEDNPLGMHGEIAKAYAELIHIMWSGDYSYTVPRNFKYAVGRFAPQFSGYQQQDSQELMAFLLDGLHEDLNRIKKKPYVELKDANNRPDKVVADESWNNYKLRNDSIIVDTFHGLLKSTVKCPECEKISVTFDPFCYLSLPLPVKKERQIDVFWVPMDPQKKLTQFKLTVPKTGGVVDLCEALSVFVGVQKEKMVVTDVYNHRFHKVFTMNEAISQIMDRDDIFIYEIPADFDEKNQLILPIYLREERGRSYSYQQHSGTYQLFGQPLLLPVPRKNFTYDQLYNLVLQRLSRFVSVPAESEKWWVKEKTNDVDIDNIEDNNSANDSHTHQYNGVGDGDENVDSGMEISNGESSTSEFTPDDENPPKYIEISGRIDGETNNCDKTVRMFKFTVVNSYGTAEIDYKFVDDGNPLKLDNRMYVAIDWNSIAKDKFYNDSIADSIEAHESMKNRSQKKQVIQLNDCLELFTTTEELGENDPWYCPACKKHQQATKKFDLWSLPDTLIIHLKRFSYNRYWRDKIDVLVEFPSKEFDLGKYVIDPDPDRKRCVYELIGVSNHYGGLGGGHYTAYCRNCETDSWYYFDDSSVSTSSDESTVTKAAYVLVYQRKDMITRKPRNVTATVTQNGDMDGAKDMEDMDIN